MSKIIDEMCPEEFRIFKRDQTKKWYNKELRKLKQAKRQAERKLKKNPTSIEHLDKYRKAKNLYSSSLKLARSNFYSEKISSFTNDPKSLFKVIRDLTGYKQEKVFPSQDCERVTAEKMCDFYLNKVEKIRKFITDGGSRNIIIDEEKPSITQSSSNDSLDEFTEITTNDLQLILSSLKKKFSKSDPIPTTILISAIDLLYPIILHIINKSISECIFPSPLKHALIIPILKSSTLDTNTFNNYRPISLLPYLSKILEKVLYLQLNHHIEKNNLHATMQSSYRNLHSCETALIKIIDDVQHLIHNDKNVVMILLDSSAAFDTVDHDNLFKKLEVRFDVKNRALKLIQSYLSSRTFSILINQSKSNPRDLKYGVPQGSQLGPLLYILYTKEIQSIVEKHGMMSHMYADDCQLYITFSQDNISNAEVKINSCLSDIKLWMDANFLKLNTDKTQFKIFQCKSSKHLDFTSLKLNLSETVTLLGVDITDNLKLHKFIGKKVRTCYLHLRNFSNIQNNLDFPTRIKLVTNQILSTLDYCNILLLGSTDSDIRPLKLMLNRAIRFIFRINSWEHITPYYSKLQLLPMRQRIIFKACSMSHKIFYGLAPTYLTDNFEKFKPTTSIVLRNKTGRDDYMFAVNKNTVLSKNLVSKMKLLWNSLPYEIRQCESAPLFKSKLKTRLLSEI